MNKENLFVYEEDGFCELRYTYGDLKKFERKSKKYDKLESNWNSLRECIDYQLKHNVGSSVESSIRNHVYQEIKDKMNELESGDNK